MSRRTYKCTASEFTQQGALVALLLVLLGQSAVRNLLCCIKRMPRAG
jgi:hypothetical protein